MPERVLFSIVESPMHPDFSRLYSRLGIRELRLGSMRKAIGQLKKDRPDYVVAEFFYGYGNNYAGVNVSNLDVFLYSTACCSIPSANGTSSRCWRPRESG
jgi:hypothetical protein